MKQIGLGLAIAALLVVAACGGGSGGTGASKTFVASGTIELLATGNTATGDTCVGTGGYDDIQPGASVVVTDAGGKKLALGQLDDGKPGGYQTCTFAFKVKDVPSGVGPYSIEVSHRGESAFNESDASSINLSLG